MAFRSLASCHGVIAALRACSVRCRAMSIVAVIARVRMPAVGFAGFSLHALHGSKTMASCRELSAFVGTRRHQQVASGLMCQSRRRVHTRSHNACNGPSAQFASAQGAHRGTEAKPSDCLSVTSQALLARSKQGFYRKASVSCLFTKAFFVPHIWVPGHPLTSVLCNISEVICV